MYACMLQNEHDRTMLKGYRRVAIVEEFYDILQQIHDKESVHAGSRKTYARVRHFSSLMN